jgi:hypothetical protein
MLTGTGRQYTILKPSLEVTAVMTGMEVGAIIYSVDFLQFGIYTISLLDANQVTACEIDIQVFNMRPWHTHFLLLPCPVNST